MAVPSKRILSLRDTTAKMSKSAPLPASRISITDSPTQILSKLKSAVTDSVPTITYDPESRPGVSNLLLIWSALDGSGRTPEMLAEEAQKGGWGMARLKEVVGEVVVERLTPVREEYERLRGEEGFLREVAESGRVSASEVAGRTMREVRKAVGLSRI